MRRAGPAVTCERSETVQVEASDGGGMTEDELVNRFAYHAPTGDKANKHQTVRGACFQAARTIDELAPDCREKSLALTALEEAMMWGNAAIARNPEAT